MGASSRQWHRRCCCDRSRAERERRGRPPVAQQLIESVFVPGVFDGVRVLDLTDGIAGRMTAMMLADNGADVTRIDTPEHQSTPLTAGERVWTRGTRNAMLDLADRDDLVIVRALARRTDVVLESFR